MAGKKTGKVEELEKIYMNIDKLGNASKHWDRVDEVIRWLEGLEEYEKCAELADMKKAMLPRKKG
jgi:hypothetical protein